MTTEKPTISIEMVYSKNHDLYALDVRLNKKAEQMLAQFKSDSHKISEYTMPNGDMRTRYLMKDEFVGSFKEKNEMERHVLAALFDRQNFGTGKRLMFAGDHQIGLNEMTYMKELFRVFAKNSATIHRKIVAKIMVV